MRTLLTSRPVAILVVLGALLLLLFFVPSRLFGAKVPVLLATQGELIQSVVASGKVRSPQRIELASQITGKIVSVPVREGQRVAAGELLVQLDDSEWRASALQARAALAQSETRLSQMKQLALPLAEQSLRQAEANLMQARRQHERTRALVAKGFYSKTQLDDTQRNLDVAESQAQSARLQTASNQVGGSDYRLAQVAIDQSRANLAIAETRLGYAGMTAPSEATVLTRSAEPGDTAQPGKVLMTLSPVGETELIVQIDEKNLGLLKLGQKALASADAYPDQRFDAEVSFISPAVDALRGSVEIRLRVPQPPAYLRQEMTVSIDIETARRANAIIAPIETIRDAGTAKPWVLVVRDGIIRRQEVSLGVRSKGLVEIIQGVAPADQLIPASQSGLSDGSRVRPIAP